MRVVVYTCDRYAWSLMPFAWLFNRYWSELQPVLVGGFTVRPPLPANFAWRRIDGRDYPAQEWSDGLIKLLEGMDDEVFVWMLDDYWLCRTVDCDAIGSLHRYMLDRGDILRIDLTGDRLHSGHAKDVGAWGRLDLVETGTDTPYQWSTQACMVRRVHMLRCLRPGLAPWEFELLGNELIPSGLRILGTRQWPLRYVNAVGMGLDPKYHYRTEHVREGMGGLTIERIDPRHVEAMRAEEILPPQQKA